MQLAPNLAKNFDNSHTRNISVILFQNLTADSRKEFFYVPIVQVAPPPRPPPPLEPCLLMNQNFANNFWKGSPKENLSEIISKSDQLFQRRRIVKNFFMSIYSDHFGPCHCTTGSFLSLMAHENMTKALPLKILKGTKSYSDCAEKNQYEYAARNTLG